MSARRPEDPAGRPWTPVPLVRGRHGAVVAPHHLATAAGLHMLRLGGSAVDAAIATNAVLGVVMPSGCGIGGDAFWLIWDEAAGRQTALNGSGRAPAAADPVALRARGLRELPRRGPLSITVPGAVRSWGDAHARHGRLARDVVLGPAIDLARGGFPAWEDLIGAVEGTSGRLAEVPGVAEGFHAVYRPHGRPWRPGEVVRLPALASTLEHIATDGFDAFYDGELGEQQAAGLAAVGSAITAADLRDHRSTWTEPIEVDYRGVRVTSHPPNSSGVVALQLLAILARFEAPARSAFGPDGVTDAAWIHLGLEASKLAMADRDATVTDPAFRDGQVEALLDPARIAELAARIDPGRAAAPPSAANPRGGGTIYLATVDGDGNAVSLIESNYMGFGSGVVDPRTGVHYQNRGSYFSLDPGHPNALEPGKRTLHTLLPGMLFRSDRPGPWIVAGSMGGDAQPQIHAQFVSAVVDGGVDVRTAVAAPRWFIEPADHFEPPTEVHLEPRHADGLAEALTGLGHRLVPTDPFDSGLGHEHAIELVDGGPAADGGSLAAATDPRSSGLPAVW
ncbi:MAG TPA: gamma-glutamyltransferase family protein [Candidatus Saccharimonadales bacterium]|nr:gamma-glutamyltransferase family protein [Candidatus Saccharimonadales bacterium]